MYNGEAINADGTLNIAKLEILSKKIGFEYSKRSEALNNQENNKTNTVIIKEGPRSGVNINIGR